MNKLLFVLAALAILTPYRRVAAQSGDPSGFTDALNVARAQRGLAPVAYDPGQASLADRNNGAQCGRGLGHHVMSGVGQCAAQSRDAMTALAQWLASPPHAAILLNPGAASCGFAMGGGYATANVGGGYAAVTTYWAGWTYSVPTYGHARPVKWRMFRRGRNCR